MVQVNGRAFRPSQDLTLIKTSTLKEVSIVVIGADGSTSVAIAASSSQGKSMTEKTVEELRTEAAAETEHINAIRKACDGRYGPVRDVKFDAETGLLQWSTTAQERKPDLIQRVAEYFERRYEDE